MLKRIALTVALALSGLAIMAPTPAQAVTPWSGYVNESSIKCMDVKDRSTANGAMIQEYPCKVPNTTDAQNQLFQPQPSGTHSQLVNYNSGKCIELVNGSLVDGGTVWQWACNGATKQQWDVVFVSQNSKGVPTYQFRSVVSGKCLTRADSGSPLYQVTCNSADLSQLWRPNVFNGDCQTCINLATRKD